jgi:UDP-glucose 4-epimerase
MSNTRPIAIKPRRTLLVIGGCGYIGSHMVKCLLNAGHRVVVLDDLSGGYRDALLGGELVVGDFGEREVLGALFRSRRFDGVLHFASLIQVGESMRDPALYYRCNMAKVLTLLEAVRDHHVPALVFSSSAAVYGEPSRIPIDESHPCLPINPYGMTKHVVETMLRDFSAAYGLHTVALRYFNAAGADSIGRLGERHQPESHLIPLALQAALGARPALTVFGRDYDTPDGTCIRDYVHVDDLADAHLLALEYLWNGGASTAFNLGNGAGFSVQQVIDMVKTVSGVPVPVEESARRDGDPARLVADATRARQVLGWAPRYGNLETIVRHAWRWELLRPDGWTATRRYGNEQAT